MRLICTRCGGRAVPRDSAAPDRCGDPRCDTLLFFRPPRPPERLYECQRCLTHFAARPGSFGPDRCPACGGSYWLEVLPS